MTSAAPIRTTWLLVGRELGLAFLAALAYFGVRGFTEANAPEALRNADRIEDLQRTLGILVEPELQNLITHSTWMVNVVNWIYIWGHWPLIFLVAAWLIRYHPEMYRLTRNAFLISGGLGLIVFATFPVAPPRLTDLDVVDTVTQNSNAYRFLQPPAFTNQYAAMPSLHFGWNLLIGIAVFRVVDRRLLKAIAVLIPVGMGIAVVLTANHYILDAVAGGAFALVALWGAAIRSRQRRDHLIEAVANMAAERAGEPEEHQRDKVSVDV